MPSLGLGVASSVACKGKKKDSLKKGIFFFGKICAILKKTSMEEAP